MAIKEPQPARARGQAASQTPHPPPERIVQPIFMSRSPRRGLRLGSLRTGLGFPGGLARGLIGAVAGIVGVALVTLLIGFIMSVTHVKNLSIIYLLVVLWLAVSFGRGPAILASFLAFLANDFFFIPPVHRFTVDDPAEWVSLLALLATALVIGQLAATVQAHARESQASQQRMARLYALAQMVAASSDEEQLLQVLVQRVVQVFASSGVAAAALFLPNAERQLVSRAASPAAGAALDALSLEGREQGAMATWALQQGAPVGVNVTTRQPREPGQQSVYYFPLWSGHRVIGVLGIAGAPETRRLVTRLPTLPAVSSPIVTPQPSIDPQAELFAAFCGQIALAVERDALRQQAIHAEALREGDRLKHVLLTSVTHDLRTPLASIKAATTSLLEPSMTWHAEDRREFIESIDASVDRLTHLVRNVLDLSRLESGAAAPEKDWYLIGEVIDTAISQLEQAGQCKGRQVQVDAPETLPLVPLDHDQIERVLINLLENALKYSPPESVVRVQARVVGTPPELEVRVIDQGIGIPADELEVIFDKFYRGRQSPLPWASTGAPAGTGLGLAICANIIQAHDGHLWAESRPGQGATFIFTLPLPADRPQGALPELSLAGQVTPGGTE